MALTAAEKQKFTQLETDLVEARKASTAAIEERDRVVSEAAQRTQAAEREAETAKAALIVEQDAHSATKRNAEASIKQLVEDRNTLDRALIRANADNKELNAELTKATTSTTGQPTQEQLEHQGQKLKLTAKKFIIDGRERTAEEVTNGSQLLDRLVALDYAFLEKVD